MMKKAIFIVVVVLFTGVFFSFLMDEDDQQRGGTDRRVAVERVMEAYNLRFSKEVGQTSIIFQLAVGDSIKIECTDCPLAMGATEDKGYLRMSMQSLDGTQQLEPSSFGRWIKVKSGNGKFGLVFERDGLGEKLITLKSMLIWRKTRKPFLDEAGTPSPVLDINNVYIDKLTKDNTAEQTTFFFRLKSEDQVQVTIKGANGAVPENLVCQVYKYKEEFDKTPIAAGPPFPVPKVDGGADRFAFEFSHIKDVKGINTYHIDVARIPAHSTGYLDIPPPAPDTVDSVVAAPDTVLPPDGSNDLFLAYLEKLAGGPNFQCVTPEGEISNALDGTLVLGMTKRSKICFDLPLSDECVASEPCEGCDTLWAFWIGAGQDIMNRYRFADSTRKIVSGKGLVEAYARSKKYRGMQGGALFPQSHNGEDIFFAVVDQFEKQRFLNSDLDGAAWIGDGMNTVSPGEYVSSYQYMLRFNPARPLSLCLCNNNSVSTVPFLFKFQQFLTEPKKPDTLAVLPEIEETFEYEEDESDTEGITPSTEEKEPVEEEEDPFSDQ